MMDGVVDRAPAGLGQADVAGPVKHQQECAANLVAQLAIGLNPVLGFADFLGQGVAMQARVVSDGCRERYLIVKLFFTPRAVPSKTGCFGADFHSKAGPEAGVDPIGWRLRRPLAIR